MGLEEEMFNLKQSNDGVNSNLDNMGRDIESYKLKINELQISEERLT